MPIMPVATGDVIQVLVQYRLNNQQLFNVFHYEYLATPTVTEYFAAMAEILTEVNAAGQWVKRYIAAASEDCVVWDISAQRVSLPRGPRHVLSVVDPGAVVGAAAPQNLCMSITRTVDAVGRGVNGRVQVPGLPVAGITDGLWNAGQIAAVETMADCLTHVLEPGLDPPVLQPVTYQYPAGTTNKVIGRVIHEEVRTMHRRTVGLGI